MKRTLFSVLLCIVLSGFLAGCQKCLKLSLRNKLDAPVLVYDGATGDLLGTVPPHTLGPLRYVMIPHAAADIIVEVRTGDGHSLFTVTASQATIDAETEDGVWEIPWRGQ